MADIKKGSICRSLAGHDKGTYYIIVETGNVIKVSDGNHCNVHLYVKLSLPFPAESFCTADKIE